MKPCHDEAFGYLDAPGGGNPAIGNREAAIAPEASGLIVKRQKANVKAYN